MGRDRVLFRVRGWVILRLQEEEEDVQHGEGPG